MLHFSSAIQSCTLSSRDTAVSFSPLWSQEAHYDAKTNARIAVVLTFAPGQAPAKRASERFTGCVLQPVVTPPVGAGPMRRVVWYRIDGHVRKVQIVHEQKILDAR